MTLSRRLLYLKVKNLKLYSLKDSALLRSNNLRWLLKVDSFIIKVIIQVIDNRRTTRVVLILFKAFKLKIFILRELTLS